MGDLMVQERSLIAMINDLAFTEDDDVVKNVSAEISDYLSDHDDHAYDVVYSVVERLPIFMTSWDFASVTQSDFYSFQSVVYVDVDNVTKISFRMVFLQDFENLVEDADISVAETALRFLKRKNLDIVVNDVCVNSVHYVNGKKV